MTNSLLQQGYQYLQTGQLELAKGVFLDIINQQADNGLAFLGLGRIAVKVFDYDRAITLISQACQLLPESVEPLLELSECFNAVSSPPDALTALKFAYQHNADNRQVLSALIQQHIRMGESQSAEQLLKQQIANDDPVFSAYGWLDRVRVWHTPLTAQQWSLLKSQLEGTGAASHAKMLLNYALGQAYDKTAQYTLAAVHLGAANDQQLTQCQFHTQQLKPMFDAIIDCYSRLDAVPEANPNKIANMSMVPVFIVGLPRTGSTLLEQMLAGHTEIDSVGEQSYLSDICVPILENASKHRFPHCAIHSDTEHLAIAANQYCEIIRKQCSTKYVINKLPANTQNIGLIFSLFPHAKIIHLRREIRDVSLSVYKNYFAENEPYFCNIQQFQLFANYTDNLMAHWHTVYAQRLLSVNYEDLVSQTHSTVKQVLDYLDLPMQEACLHPLSSGNSVDTLSAIEVRKPISKSSVGGWQNYADSLFTAANT